MEDTSDFPSRLRVSLTLASSSRPNSSSAIRSAIYHELHTLRSYCSTTSQSSQSWIASTDAALRTLFSNSLPSTFTRSILILLAETYIALFRLLPTVSLGSNNNGGSCGVAVRGAIDYFSKLSAIQTTSTFTTSVSNASQSSLSNSTTGARVACIFLCGELSAAFGSFAVSSSSSSSSISTTGAENALSMIAKICIKKSNVGSLFSGIGGVDSSSDVSLFGVDSGAAVRAASATAVYRIIEGCGSFFQTPGKVFQLSIKILQSIARDTSFAVRATVGPFTQALACSFAVHGLLSQTSSSLNSIKGSESISINPSGSGSPLSILLDHCEAGLTDPHPTVRLGCAFGLASVLATAVNATKVGTVAAEAATAALRTMALRGTLSDGGDIEGFDVNNDDSGGGEGDTGGGFNGGDGMDGFEGGDDIEGDGTSSSSSSNKGGNSSFSTPPRATANSKGTTSKSNKSVSLANDNFAKSFRKIGSSLQDAVARTARTLGPGGSGSLGNNSRGSLQGGSLAFTIATALQYVASLIRSSGKLAAKGSGAKAGDIRAAASISCASLLRSIRSGVLDSEISSVILAALSPLERIENLGTVNGEGKRKMVVSSGVSGGGVVLSSPTCDSSSISGGLPIAGPSSIHAQSCVLHILESGLAEPPHTSAASYNHEGWSRWLKMLLSEATNLLIKQASALDSRNLSSSSSGLMSTAFGTRVGGGVENDIEANSGLLNKVLGSVAVKKVQINNSTLAQNHQSQMKSSKNDTTTESGIMNRFASSFKLGDKKKMSLTTTSSSSSSSSGLNSTSVATNGAQGNASTTISVPLLSGNATSVLVSFAVSLLPRCGLQQGGDDMRSAVSLLLAPCLAFVGAPCQALRASAIKALVALARLNPTSLPDLVMACTATIRHAHAQLASPSAHAATAAAAASTALADASNFSALRRSSMIAMSGTANGLNTSGASAHRGFLATLSGAASTNLPSDSSLQLCSLSFHGGGSPLTSSSIGFGTPGSGKGSGLGVCGVDDASELLKLHSFSIALAALVSLSSKITNSNDKESTISSQTSSFYVSVLPSSLIQDILQLTSVLLSVGRDDRLTYGGTPATGIATDAAAIAALQHGNAGGGGTNMANNPVAALAQSAAAAAAAEVEACCVRAGFGIMTSLCCLGSSWLSSISVWPVIYTLLTEELIRFVKDADRSGVGSSRDGSGAFLLSPLGVPPSVATATTLIAQATSHSTSSASAIALGGAGLTSSSSLGESPFGAALAGILGSSGAYDGLGLATARSTYCGVSNSWTLSSLPHVTLALLSVIKTATGGPNSLHASGSLQESLAPLMQLGLTILTEQRIVPASLAAALSATSNSRNGGSFNGRLAAFSDAALSLSLRPSSSQFITLGAVAGVQTIYSSNLYSSDPTSVATATAMSPPVVRGVSWGADDASLYSPCGVSLSAIAISRKSYLQATGFILEAATLLPLSSIHFLNIRGPLLSASVAVLTGGAMSIVPLEIGLISPTIGAKSQKQQTTPYKKPRAARILPSSDDASRVRIEGIDILLNRSSALDPETCSTWSPLVLALAHSPVPSISKNLLCAHGGEDVGAGAPPTVSSVSVCKDSHQFEIYGDNDEKIIPKSSLNPIFFPSVVEPDTDLSLLSQLCLPETCAHLSIENDINGINFSSQSSWESAAAVASIVFKLITKEDETETETENKEEEEKRNDSVDIYSDKENLSIISKMLQSSYLKSALRFPTLYMTQKSNQRLGHAAIAIMSSLLPQLPLGQANSLVVALSAPLKLAASLALINASDERDRSHIASLNETIQSSSTGTGFRIAPLSLTAFDSDASSRNMASALLCLVAQLRPEHVLSPQDESSNTSPLPVQWLLSARTGIAAGLSHPNHEVRLACAEGLAELCRVCGPFSSFSRKLILTLQKQAGLTNGGTTGSGDVNETTTTTLAAITPNGSAFLAPTTMSGVLCAISRIARCTTELALKSSKVGAMLLRASAKNESHRLALLLAKRVLCKDHADAVPFFFDETDPDEEIVPSAFLLAEPLLSRIAIDALSSQLQSDLNESLLGAHLHTWATILWAITALVQEEDSQLSTGGISSETLFECLRFFKRFIGPTLAILDFHIANASGSFSPFDTGGTSPLLSTSSLKQGTINTGIDTARLPSLLSTHLGAGSGASSFLFDGNGPLRQKSASGIQQPGSPAGINVAAALGATQTATPTPALVGFASHVLAAHGFRFPGGGGVAVSDRLGGVVAISEAADFLASKGAYVQSQGSGNWRPHTLSTAAVLPIFHPATGEVLPSPLMITSLEGSFLALNEKESKGAFSSLLGNSFASSSSLSSVSISTQDDSRNSANVEGNREESIGVSNQASKVRVERAVLTSLGDIRAHWKAVATAGGQAAVRALAVSTVSTLEQSGGLDAGAAVLPISGYSGCDEGNEDCSINIVLSGILRSLLLGLSIFVKHSSFDDIGKDIDILSIISQCSFVWSSLCTVPNATVARNCVQSLALLSELVPEPQGAMSVLLPFAMSVARAAVAGPGGTPSHSSPMLMNERPIFIPLLPNPINEAIEAISMLPISQKDSSKLLLTVGAVHLGCERLGVRWACQETLAYAPAASLQGRYCAAAVVGTGLSSGLVPCAMLQKSVGGEEAENNNSSGAADASVEEEDGDIAESSAPPSSSTPSLSLLGQVLDNSFLSGSLGRRHRSAIVSVPASMQSPACSGLALLSRQVKIEDINSLLYLLDRVNVRVSQDNNTPILPIVPFPGVDASLGIAGDVFLALDILADQQLETSLLVFKHLLRTVPDVYSREISVHTIHSKVTLIGAEWIQCLCDAILHESTIAAHNSANKHAKIACQAVSQGLIAQASKKGNISGASSDFGPSEFDEKNDTVAESVTVLEPTEQDLLQFDSDLRRSQPPETLSLEFVSIYPILSLEHSLWRFVGNNGTYLALEGLILQLSFESNKRSLIISESLISSILRAACVCIASDGGLDESDESSDAISAPTLSLTNVSASRASSRNRTSGLRLILALLNATRTRADKDIPSQHCLQQHQALLLGALLPCLSSSSSHIAQNLAAIAILQCVAIGVFTGASAARRITKTLVNAWADVSSLSSPIGERNTSSTLLESVSGLLLLAIFVPGRENVLFETRFPAALSVFEEEIGSSQQSFIDVLERVFTIKRSSSSTTLSDSQLFSSSDPKLNAKLVIRLPSSFREAIIATIIPSLADIIKSCIHSRDKTIDKRISLIPFTTLCAAAFLSASELSFPVFSIDSCFNRFSADVLAQFVLADSTLGGSGKIPITLLASTVASNSSIVLLLPLLSNYIHLHSKQIANLIATSLCESQPDLPSSFSITRALLMSRCASSLCNENSFILSWMSISLSALVAYYKTDMQSIASLWGNLLLPLAETSHTNALQEFVKSMWQQNAITNENDSKCLGSLTGMSSFLTSSTCTVSALPLAILSIHTSATILKNLCNNNTLADCTTKEVESSNIYASMVFNLITAVSNYISSFANQEFPNLLKSCLPFLIGFMQPGIQQGIDSKDNADTIDTGWVRKEIVNSASQCAFNLAKKSPIAFKAFLHDLDIIGQKTRFESAMRSGLALSSISSIEPLSTRFKEVSYVAVASESAKTISQDSVTATPTFGSFKLLAKKFSLAAATTTSTTTTQAATTHSTGTLQSAPSSSLLQIDEEDDWMIAARKARDAERNEEDEEEDEEEEKEEENEEEDDDKVKEKETEQVDTESQFVKNEETVVEQGNKHTLNSVAQENVAQENEDDDFADFNSATSFPEKTETNSWMTSPSGKSVTDTDTYSPAKQIKISQDGVVDLPDEYTIEEEEEVEVDDKDEDFADFNSNEPFSKQSTAVAVVTQAVGVIDEKEEVEKEEEDFGDFEESISSSVFPSVVKDHVVVNNDNNINDDDDFGELS